MKIGKHLDWLSITLLHNVEWREFLPHTEYRLDGKGRHGYRQLWIDDIIGTRVETFADDPRMGHHVTLSGDTLHGLRDNYALTDEDIVKRAITAWGQCSRIDLAIDMQGCITTIADMDEAIRLHTARFPARTWRFIAGHTATVVGDTIDTGSPKSDRRFRAYDKAAEQRIVDHDSWIRLEMQLRRVYAKSALGACAEHGVAAVTSGIIGKYLRWENDEYQAAIAGACDELPKVARKHSHRQMWLLGQCASALADEVIRDEYFLETFLIAMRGFMEKKRGGDLTKPAK